MKFSWLHLEPKGIKAITEAGGHGGSLGVGRLYLYPDGDPQTLHLLTIGNKKKQSEDIVSCQKIVDKIRAGK